MNPDPASCEGFGARAEGLPLPMRALLGQIGDLEDLKLKLRTLSERVAQIAAQKETPLRGPKRP